MIQLDDEDFNWIKQQQCYDDDTKEKRKAMVLKYQDQFPAGFWHIRCGDVYLGQHGSMMETIKALINLPTTADINFDIHLYRYRVRCFVFDGRVTAISSAGTSDFDVNRVLELAASNNEKHVDVFIHGDVYHSLPVPPEDRDCGLFTHEELLKHRTRLVIRDVRGLFVVPDVVWLHPETENIDYQRWRNELFWKITELTTTKDDYYALLGLENVIRYSAVSAAVNYLLRM